MSTARPRSYKLLFSAGALLCLGCPQLLKDDFRSETASAGTSGNGNPGGAATGSTHSGGSSGGAATGSTHAGGTGGIATGGGTGGIATGGGTATGGAGGVPSCGSLTTCGNSCVELQTSEAHCGRCNHACLGGRSCDAGNCSAARLSLAAAGLSARSGVAATATASEFFVWGGIAGKISLFNDGALYDPKLDTWRAVGTTGARPSARAHASAIWTGQHVFVFGGENKQGDPQSDGGLYDPTRNEWLAVASGGPARIAPHLYLSDGVVWLLGGTASGPALESLDAYRFDPKANNWLPGASSGSPSARSGASFAASANALFVCGATPASADCFELEFSKNTWTKLPATAAAARSDALACWDGSVLANFGGRDAAELADGYWFKPGQAGVTTVQGTLPSARHAERLSSGVWLGVEPARSALAGGLGGAKVLREVWLFESAANRFSHDASWDLLQEHRDGGWASLNGELLVWGGTHDGTHSALGERVQLR